MHTRKALYRLTADTDEHLERGCSEERCLHKLGQEQIDIKSRWALEYHIQTWIVKEQETGAESPRARFGTLIKGMTGLYSEQGVKLIMQQALIMDQTSLRVRGFWGGEETRMKTP
jgi:hypothetical protein